MYANGRGVSQDSAEAARWCRKAADQGLPSAQFVLGNIYFEGEGVPQDYVQAHKWFNLAAAKNYTAGDMRVRDEAVKNRDLVAKRMTPAEIAAAQKQASEWNPSKCA